MPTEDPRNNAPDKEQAAREQATAPVAKKSSGSWRSWPIIVISLAALSYLAYTSGWLDWLPGIPDYSNRLGVIFPGESSTAGDFSSPKTLPPPVGLSETDRDDNAARREISAYADLFDSISSRMSKLERAMRIQQRLTGQLAEDIARLPVANGEKSSAQTGSDLIKLRIDMIDMRLRLTGDSDRAETELGHIAADAAVGTLDDEQIGANRARLAALPPRAILLEKLMRVALLAKELARETQTRSDDERDNLLGEMLGGILEIRKDAPAALNDTGLALGAASHADSAARALVLGAGKLYGGHLALLREVVGKLADTQSEVRTLEIAQLVAQIAAVGNPEYRLLSPSRTGGES